MGLFARFTSAIDGALRAQGLQLRPTKGDPATASVEIAAVRGTPTGAPSGVGVAVDVEAAGLTTLLWGYAAGAWGAFMPAGTLASTASGAGASLIGIEDAAASLKGTTVEAALAEIATPLSLTAGAESGDDIAVTVAGTAHVAQYLAELFDDEMEPLASTAFTMAETGAGAEVSTTAKAKLLFTTSAAGAATLTVHDVAGASGATIYLRVSPCGVSAGAHPSPAAIIALTFDGS
jgi:hypothetical protein